MIYPPMSPMVCVARSIAISVSSTRSLISPFLIIMCEDAKAARSAFVLAIGAAEISDAGRGASSTASDCPALSTAAGTSNINSSLMAGASVDGAAPHALRISAPNSTNKINRLKRIFIFFSFRIFITALYSGRRKV